MWARPVTDNFRYSGSSSDGQLKITSYSNFNYHPDKAESEHKIAVNKYHQRKKSKYLSFYKTRS